MYSKELRYELGGLGFVHLLSPKNPLLLPLRNEAPLYPYLPLDQLEDKIPILLDNIDPFEPIIEAMSLIPNRCPRAY